MDVRERDDTGWGELPGGLSFSDVEPDDDLPPRRRGLRAFAWVLVLGVLLGGGGAWGARWLGDADVRGVLASSTSTYGAMLERLRQAPDAQRLAAVAVGAPGAVDRLEADLRRLGTAGSSRRSAVAAQVAAERDVLVAVAALHELDGSPLRVWGQAHADLAAAVRAEEATRSSLRLADPDAARRLPDTAAVFRRIATTVGEAVVTDVTRAAADLLADLDAATRTADLREAAARAQAQRTAVTAAGSGLGGGADAAVLAAFGDGLLAVAELRALTPEATGVWPPVRVRLQSSLRVVSDADSSVAAGTVRARLPLVLDAVDRLVTRAEQAHAAWQPRFDAAVAAQSADAAALRMHAEQVRGAAAGWPALRAAVEGLTRPGAGPADLDDAWAGVDGLRLALAATSPHAKTQAAHEDLLRAVADVELPLRQAREQTLPGPVSVGRLLDAWEPALAAWEAALAAAETEVATRSLPAAPDA